MAEYIDREALRQFPIRKDHYDKENGNENFVFGIEAVLEYAENLPAADVAPVRHGRWIKENGRCGCSSCRNGIKSISENISVWIDLSCLPLCPFCGAKMDGE